MTERGPCANCMGGCPRVRKCVAVLIPKDPEQRARLAQMAGLSDEERRAINEWCHLQAVENETHTRRGLEAHGDNVMAGDGVR